MVKTSLAAAVKTMVNFAVGMCVCELIVLYNKFCNKSNSSDRTHMMETHKRRANDAYVRYGISRKAEAPAMPTNVATSSVKYEPEPPVVGNTSSTATLCVWTRSCRA